MGISKMDSSAVYALFEELQQKLDELGKKALTNDQADSTLNSDELISLIEDLQIQINQLQFTPEQIKVLQTNMAQYSTYFLGKVNDSLRKVFTEFKTVITPIDENINLIKSQKNVVIRNEHVFIVDFRNNKAAITIISLALLILISLGGNFWQFDKNSQFKDNDLKYRYIKQIREIRGKVEQYEMEIKEIAERLERERMKNAKEKR